MNMNVSITVLTATYNRAYKLGDLYDSLLMQKDLIFDWLIIDDGSLDDTFIKVKKIQDSSPFSTRYIYKPNGGKHTALNIGIMEISTDLVIFVDSDDILLPDAIQSIKSNWITYFEHNLTGIFYLKGYRNGNVIGDSFPIDMDKTSYVESRLIQKVSGDKAEVWRTNVLKRNLFPQFEGEFFLSEQYIYAKISETKNVVVINKIICLCEYLDDGLSKKIRYLQFNNPKGALLNAEILADKKYGRLRRVKSGIQIVIFSIAANQNPIVNLKRSKFYLLAFYLTFGCLIFLMYKLNYKYLMSERIIK